ncbi:hypothetical protein N9975_01785 [bacterium]|nr:hypothetical protein [Porticoccaceae bacterium]MDB4322325.1 hypothetical protein [bacterium]MDB9724481.1 hypothetical protein [bacterium]MDB9952708.1 hypothetical protein [Porticoccaceae bacterium]
MNTEFSEDERNNEEVDFVKAVVQGLIDIEEGNTYTLEEVKIKLKIS